MKNLMILMLCITSIFGIQNANAQNGFCIAGLATELEDSGSSDVLNLNLFDASFVLSIDSINGEFITEWEWTLNGAFLSDEQNPTTVVTIGGEYEVCLTINTNLGCASSVCEVINFNADDCENVVGFLIEAAGFEVSVNGNTANFEQWTTEFPGSENIVYNWDFGDGNTSTETNPTHEYAESGVFMVCSEATDIVLNCSAEWCDSLFVGDVIDVCNADFWAFPTDTLSPIGGNSLSWEFVDNSSAEVVEWYWTFGNPNYFSNEQNPSFTFSEAGTYEVCLTITTTNLCTDTACEVIVIENAGGFCIAGLTTELEDSGSSDVLNLNLFDASFSFFDNIIEWEWTLNGAFLSDEQNPTTVVTIGGEYEVCLTINTNSGCTSSVCDVINFNVDDCENVVGFLIEAAGFEVSVNGNTANFEQWTTEFPGSENVVYNWDFGDGNTSTETNPTHEYAESGAFIVCSEATDIELNCSAEWCDSLFVGSGSTNYELCGNILIETDSNAMTDFDATVYLIEYDAAANTYETVAETIVYGSVFGADSSFAWFCFGDLPEGSEYIVKAAINPTNILFDGFVPTYYGDVIFWNEATVITMTENEYIDINMVSILDGFEGLATNDDVGELGIAVSNEGTVNGYVMNGVAEGMPNIQVMLLTLDNQPVSYTYTNADGFYELSAIDNGEYIVYVEMIGIICIPSDVSITTENNELSINFELEGNQVSAGSVGIFDNTIASSFALDIYPNPVHNQAVIAFEVNKSSDASLSVINMLGQTVLQENINLQQGKNTLNLNVSELKSACYFLQIQDSEGKIYMTQFVK